MLAVLGLAHIGSAVVNGLPLDFQGLVDLAGVWLSGSSCA